MAVEFESFDRFTWNLAWSCGPEGSATQNHQNPKILIFAARGRRPSWIWINGCRIWAVCSICLKFGMELKIQRICHPKSSKPPNFHFRRQGAAAILNLGERLIRDCKEVIFTLSWWWRVSLPIVTSQKGRCGSSVTLGLGLGLLPVIIFKVLNLHKLTMTWKFAILELRGDRYPRSTERISCLVLRFERAQ